MTISGHKSGYRRLRILFWCAGVALGAFDAWARRNHMDSDGVSYLDIGDAYWRGDWHMAVNAYWSPLYSWLLGLALKVLKPSAYWEYPAVHLVNFLIYLAALGGFEFFLRAFVDHVRASGGDPRRATLPEWAWWTLGYSLFIWTSLVLITIRSVLPDMCVAAFVYLASGLLLRMRSGTATRRTFILLGIVLGLGYLAKAVMFPLAFVFLAVALFSSGSVRKAVPRVLVSALAFLAIAGPFIVALSRAKGRLTFGDSGRVTYAGCVNGVNVWYPGDSGRLRCDGGTVEGVDDWFPKNVIFRHPVKRIFDVPATYEFTGPIGGTYPIWYDPSYWQEGVKPQFDVKAQVQATTTAFIRYCWVFLSPFAQLNVSVGLLILVLIAPRPSLCLKRATANWPLLIPALSASCLYSVVHVEYRFVAAFAVLLWLAAFSGLQLPASPESRRLIAGVVIAVAATSALSTLWWSRQRANAKNAAPVYWEAARALEKRGIHAGDKVAVISDEPWGPGGSLVARLARIRLIAQVNRPDRYWTASSATQSQVIEAIAGTGAKAILSWKGPPRSVPDPSWQQLGGTDYYARILESDTR